MSPSESGSAIAVAALGSANGQLSRPGRRSIPLVGVARRLHRHRYAPSSLLAQRAPQRPSSIELSIRGPLGAAAGFGWLDARLWRDGWLEVLTAEDLAVYAFLCLVADRQGVSKKVPAYR